ncbi:PTS glucose transporter subunit IIA [Pseudoalteromonas xiamenensis]|uniref:PTS glucose transporter subunit IIA n=1 Tax=Pseudoalteromonas xiamenensis TaxID=882626 RepID=UPI0027E59165|nr:PTS glucose transporter subunit IIA [Pseudoalteromonas xiamenensis]WMN60181.1 PTS glucose transporter subunit IIA [Pseudoalteromonas xiamenensis]
MQSPISYCPITQITQPICNLASPFSGKVVSLNTHPDPIFSSGILGKGICVELSNEIVVAPFDGAILAIKQGGLEWILESFEGHKVLIHLSLPWHLQTPEYLKLIHTQSSAMRRGDSLVRLALPVDTKALATYVVLNENRKLSYYTPLKQVKAGIDPLITIAEEQK